MSKITKKCWIVNKINPTTAEILLYGYISPHEISSADFNIELSQLCAIYTDIKIRINCGGGSIFEGLAMYNDIRAKIKSGKNITTQTDGIAASMGCIISLSGVKNTISKYGRKMIHRASGYAAGDSDDLRQQADLIDSAQADLVKIISEATGLTEAEVSEKFMQKGVDNWINSDKCMEYNLADEVYDADPVAVPEDVTDEEAVFNIFQSCLNKTSNTKSDNMKEIAKALGLPENATEAEILAAIQKQKDDAKALADKAAVANAAKAKALIDGAITNKQLTEADRAEYEKQAVENYDFTANVIAKIPAVKSITSQLISSKETSKQSGDVEEKSEYEQLVAKGQAAFAAYKNEHPAEYQRIWESHFKAPYPGA